MVEKRMSAKCSQCGRKFYGTSKGELLNKLRTHMWKNHADWMRRRIKAGLKKAKRSVDTYHAPGNPFLETVKKVLDPSWTGFAERPAIEKLTGRPYEQVRQETLDALVASVFVSLIKRGGRSPWG
ncbi:hypothetical protein ES703_121323 [subsurface metagenome]